jgi:FkbM family methyltransferase
LNKIDETDIILTTELIEKWISCACPKKEFYLKSCLIEALNFDKQIKTKYGNLSLQCPNKIAEFRARTFHEKEPETLEWIDSIGVGETLWDIGANVGLYTLYAALRGISVIAFEPSPANYHLLNSNIEKNSLHHIISAYCLAFSEKTEIGSFYMSSSEAGSALNSFGEAVDWQGKPFDPKMRQGMIAFAIDDFIKQFAPPLPNHLKIDVDGIEPLILRGASSLLSKESLLSLQIELDFGNEMHADTVIELLKKFGFKVISKRHAEMFENSEYSNLYNVLFKRKT